MDILTKIKEKYADELTKMSLKDQIKFITEKAKVEGELLEKDNAKVYIENLKTKLPDLQKAIGTPFEIYVKKVGATKTPTPVKVVGYIPDTDIVIAYYAKKLYQISKEDLITSVDGIMKPAK